MGSDPRAVNHLSDAAGFPVCEPTILSRLREHVGLHEGVIAVSTCEHFECTTCPECLAATPVHRHDVVADDTGSVEVPLCWAMEGRAKTPPATADQWWLTFEQGGHPKPPMTVDGAAVTCGECKSWMHA